MISTIGKPIEQKYDGINDIVSKLLQYRRRLIGDNHLSTEILTDAMLFMLHRTKCFLSKDLRQFKSTENYLPGGWYIDMNGTQYSMCVYLKTQDHLLSIEAMFHRHAGKKRNLTILELWYKVSFHSQLNESLRMLSNFRTDTSDDFDHLFEQQIYPHLYLPNESESKQQIHYV